MSDTGNNFISSSEAARRLGVPVSLLLRAIEAGRVPATRAGSFKNSPILVEASAVERLRQTCSDILPHAQR